MKELVIISGKGGTGKTTLVLGLASLLENKIMADCDVDAADMFLVLDPDTRHTEPFSGGNLAAILPDKCTRCGICREVCEYSAISSAFEVDPFGCEGCGACFHFCPEDAISFEPVINGTMFHSDTRLGPLYHARLKPGSENSGKLVTRVRNDARKRATEGGSDWILSDGSPGLGCPVVASITGADFVVVVTEPTVSGLHDMERVLSLLDHFRIPGGIVINKFDLNDQLGQNIERVGRSRNVPILGKIPYDAHTVIHAMNQQQTVVEYDPDGGVSRSVRSIHARLMQAVNSCI